MNKISINIEIPGVLYRRIFRLQPVARQNEFIVNAIKHEISSEDKKLKKLMAEGYKNTRKEDAEIMSDFEASDFENID